MIQVEFTWFRHNFYHSIIKFTSAEPTFISNFKPKLYRSYRHRKSPWRKRQQRQMVAVVAEERESEYFDWKTTAWILQVYQASEMEFRLLFGGTKWTIWRCKFAGLQLTPDCIVTEKLISFIIYNIAWLVRLPITIWGWNRTLLFQFLSHIYHEY